MNGYIYDNSWARFIRNNERKVKPSHIALMFAIKQIANEDGWKNEFQLSSKEAMRLSCIRDRETFYRSLKDIAEFGAITIIEDSANQHSARWVSLEELDFYLSEKQTSDHTSDTTTILTSDTTSDTSSDLHNNKLIETNKTIKSNKPKKARTQEAFDPLSETLPYPGDSFKEAWITWCEHRLAKGKPITPQSHKAQIKKLADCKNEKEAVKMIEKAIERNWDSVFPLNDLDKKDLAAKEVSVIPLNDLSDEITLERERRRGMYEVICRSSPHSKGQPMEFPEAISKFHKLIGLYDELRSA